MKRKNSFNKITEAAIQKVANKSVPLVYKPWLKFKRFLQRRPKTSIVVMFAIALINITILFKYTLNSRYTSYPFDGKVNYPFSGLGGEVGADPDFGIPFSFENYQTMKSIQDTLSWLAAKENRTAADTTVLLRLIDKIEKLDPLFFEKIKKVTYERDTTRKRK